MLYCNESEIQKWISKCLLNADNLTNPLTSDKQQYNSADVISDTKLQKLFEIAKFKVVNFINSSIMSEKDFLKQSSETTNGVMLIGDKDIAEFHKTGKLEAEKRMRNGGKCDSVFVHKIEKKTGDGAVRITFKPNYSNEKIINLASPALLARLATDDDWETRRMVAGNILTPEQALAVLAKDERSEIRYSIANNPGTPLSILKQLSKDSFEDVSTIAKERIKTEQIEHKQQKPKL
jgi:hypothetical protein